MTKAYNDFIAVTKQQEKFYRTTDFKFGQGKAKEQGLEDVRAEIEADRRDSCRTDFGEGVQYELNQAVEIVDRKIAEVKGDNK